MFEKIFKQYLPKWLVLLFFILMAAQFPFFIEKYYSRGVYVIFRNIDLFFMRLVPFSIGDLFYAFFTVWFLYQTYLKFKNKIIFFEWLDGILWKIIVWFYLLWGLNYYRLPVYIQEDLKIQIPENEKFWTFTLSEIERINTLHLSLTGDSLAPVKINNIDLLPEQARLIYNQQKNIRPYLTGYYYVVKPSLFSKPISYAGISGYFNPFTHEAQYNILYPGIYRPHILLHELAHQIGIAYENEAEFVAWLVATESGNVLFEYSSRLNALEYLLTYWHSYDTGKYKKLLKRLLPGIKIHLNEARKFALRHRIPIDLMRGYDYFLKINQKGKGLEAYSELMLYIYAYSQKQKKLAQ